MNTINEINRRIDQEVCHDTIGRLTDNNLMGDYYNCLSVKKKIRELLIILDNNGLDQFTKQNILRDYVNQLVPPGTKGVIRGNKFNSIVKEFIENLLLDPEHYDVCFEKKHTSYITSEIPDWYILHKETNKILIGMNQLDLWRGGHQLNRGFKYLIDNTANTENCKILCVVCNETRIKTNNKAFKLFEVGFKNNTLCYLKNLENIINSHFQI
jgi:hypothetical protein